MHNYTTDAGLTLRSPIPTSEKRIPSSFLIQLSGQSVVLTRIIIKLCMLQHMAETRILQTVTTSRADILHTNASVHETMQIEDETKEREPRYMDGEMGFWVSVTRYTAVFRTIKTDFYLAFSALDYNHLT